MTLKSSGKLGTGKTDLKRVEIYLTNEAYEILEKEAKKQNRKAKQYMEMALTSRAYIIKSKK